MLVLGSMSFGSVSAAQAQVPASSMHASRMRRGGRCQSSGARGEAPRNMTCRACNCFLCLEGRSPESSRLGCGSNNSQRAVAYKEGYGGHGDARMTGLR